jgi:hypothetical protein
MKVASPKFVRNLPRELNVQERARSMRKLVEDLLKVNIINIAGFVVYKLHRSQG